MLILPIPFDKINVYGLLVDQHNPIFNLANEMIAPIILHRVICYLFIHFYIILEKVIQPLGNKFKYQVQ